MYDPKKVRDAIAQLHEGVTQPYDETSWTTPDKAPEAIAKSPDWAHVAARGIMACLCREPSVHAALGPFNEAHRKVLTEQVADVVRLTYDLAVSDPRGGRVPRINNESLRRLKGITDNWETTNFDLSEDLTWKQQYSKIFPLPLTDL